MKIINLSRNVQDGFALLMSLLVVAVVITAGLSILDISIKQTRLSGNAKDSEIAFHAANAGAECARLWRRKSDPATMIPYMETKDSVGKPVEVPSVRCFGVDAVTWSGSDNNLSVSDVGSGGVVVNHYEEYRLTWGSPDLRCSIINTLVIDNSAGSDQVTVLADNIIPVILSYPVGADQECAAGAVCTIISSRGYNRKCPGFGEDFSPGTIEREVLIES